MSNPPSENLKKTPLNGLHRELGAKMVPFAGYEMPVRFEGGIIAEHLHTRSHAALFDVSALRMTLREIFRILALSGLYLARALRGPCAARILARLILW